MMTVFDVDIGHTDPQWILPYGDTMTIDGPARTITAHFGTSKSETAGGTDRVMSSPATAPVSPRLRSASCVTEP